MAEGPLTYPIKITFTSAGGRSPVYVAGSFTVPEWTPHELVAEPRESAAADHTDYVFHRTFDIAEGEFQYKFRLGHDGDWWVCDNNAEIGSTVSDELGNQNNRLINTPLHSKSDASQTTTTDGTSLVKTADGISQAPEDVSIVLDPRELLEHGQRAMSCGASYSDGKARIIDTTSPRLDKERTSLPRVSDDILRRRKDIPTSSSDPLDTISAVTPSARGGMLQQLVQWFKSILAFLFRWSAA
ncbi:MAG: hypothetical protein L6R40_002219 [Gallowayella cf. fulva]|nr:MAG: hypothetical protein L6R40_002219 [Xanthomendoza cf. fulva]